MFKPSIMAAITAACSTLPVQAATTLPAQVITASRLSSQPAGTPIYILDREDLSRLPARNLADVLGNLTRR
jgi:outer membrane cobalamin receptor